MSAFDEEQVRKIANALWTASPHSSASVMIGSGFSRNATPRTPFARPFPLWWQLTDQMAEQVYGNNRPRNLPDALRLASMYETAFGTAALDDLLLRAVPDGEHEPGDLHRLLLNLPWADVFTTNYDTLLERTHSTRRYGLVQTAADLPLQSKPRIIKLNGSFPSTRPFIITHEHFRCYPRDFAAFVNTAQQAMLETTFVLIGFSGDDPNFLQWAGWVRDHLGSAAPRLYLCGVFDLTPATLKQYESMRVTPIDLGAIFSPEDWPDKDERHQKATLWLLESLYRLRPRVWNEWPKPPTKPEPVPASALPALLEPRVAPHELYTGRQFELEVLNSNALTNPQPHLSQFRKRLASLRCLREQYPGWVNCPSPHRAYLEYDIWVSQYCRDSDLGMLCLNQLSGVEQLEALYELGWHFGLARCGLTRPLLKLMRESLESVCPFPRLLTPPEGTTVPTRNDSIDWKAVGEKWVEVAFLLIADAWEEIDEAEWKRWMARLEKIVPARPEWQARWFAEQCSWHMMMLDETRVRESLARWPQEQRLPWWEGRRAAFLGELGDTAEALELCEEALAALRVWQGSETAERRSLSQEGWLVLLSRGLKTSSDWKYREIVSERLLELARFQCDPTLELDWAEASLVKGSPQHFGPALELIRMLRETPYASQLPGVSSRGAVGVQESAYRLWPQNPWLATSLLLRGNVERKHFNAFFDRGRMAALSADNVKTLYDNLFAAVDRAHSLEKHRVSDSARLFAHGLSGHILEFGIELLARLTICLNEDTLNRVFNFACELFGSPVMNDRMALFDPLSRLFKETLQSASDLQLSGWLKQLISLPIADTREFPLPNHPWGWPEPLLFTASRSPRLHLEGTIDGSFQSTLDSLIVTAREGSQAARTTAASRLYVLHRHSMLNASQCQELATALWSRRQTNGLPSETNLRIFAFLVLPAPESVSPEELIRQSVTGGDFSTSATSENFAAEILALTREFLNSDTDLSPTLDWNLQEITSFLQQTRDRIIVVVKNPPHPLVSKWAEIHRFVDVLARVILPRLQEAPESLQHEALELLRQLDTAGFPPLATLPSTLTYRSQDTVTVTERVARGLLSTEKNQVLQACHALVYWIQLARTGSIQPPGEWLITQTCTLIGSLRHFYLNYLLQAMSGIADKMPQLFTPSQTQLLCWALEGLEDATRLESALSSTAANDAPTLLDAEVRPSLHFEAARLAWALHKKAEQDGTEPAPVLLRWKATGPNSPLPEVRRLWAS